MYYGAYHIEFAKITEEPAGSLPVYDTPVQIGSLNKVGLNPVYNEAKGHGDNAVKVHVAKFKEATLPVEVTTLKNTVAALLFGSTQDAETGEVRFNTNDQAPYGGLGFIVNSCDDDDKDVWVGFFVPKAKAVRQGVEFNTMGDTITLATSKLLFTAVAGKTYDWALTQECTTEDEALAWVAEKFASAAG